ncbi:MAG: hypothetical protein RL065_139 [Bacteroidota bacterium]|jgi:hypothetical protein
MKHENNNSVLQTETSNQNSRQNDIIFNTLPISSSSLLVNELEAISEKVEIDEKELKSRKNLVKRARAKYYTLNLMEELLKLDSPNKTMYQRTKECASLLKQELQNLSSRYCQRRDCMVCNNIRTSQLIDKYKIPFKNLGQTSFTTLTRPNVTASQLSEEIIYINKWFAKFKKNVDRYSTEKTFSGIKRIEITYNPITDTYHPHIHIGHTSGYENLIISRWLIDNPTANIKAQDTRQTDENSLTELLKYATKFVGGSKKKPIVYAQAFDTIMTGIKGKRLISAFGELYNIPINENEEFEKLSKQKYHDLPQSHFDLWYYENHDWANIKNKNPENLTGYIPSGINIEYIY